MMPAETALVPVCVYEGGSKKRRSISGAYEYNGYIWVMGAPYFIPREGKRCCVFVCMWESLFRTLINRTNIWVEDAALHAERDRDRDREGDRER